MKEDKRDETVTNDECGCTTTMVYCFNANIYLCRKKINPLLKKNGMPNSDYVVQKMIKRTKMYLYSTSIILKNMRSLRVLYY